MRRKIGIVGCGLLLGCGDSAGTEPSPGGASLAIAYTSRLEGEIEPCG